jgi:hypothetical protein
VRELGNSQIGDPSRIDENRKVIDLDSEDMKALNGLLKSHGLKRLVFPPFQV